MSLVLGLGAPALAAGLVAVLVTVAIERWGGRVGGVLGTMPSTIVPAAVGIWSQSASVDDFIAAMAVTPVGMWVDVMFLWSWRVLPGWVGGDGGTTTLVRVLVSSIALWSAAALSVVMLLGWARASGVPLPPIGIAALLLSVVFGVIACRSNPPTPGGSRPVRGRTLIARGTLAGLAIGVSVLFARVGGPLLAGVAAVFPAIFITTMVSLWWSQGRAVQAGAVGPMMLGASSVSAYALFAGVLLPMLGGVTGSVVAWLAALVVVTLPSWAWLSARARRQRPS